MYTKSFFSGVVFAFVLGVGPGGARAHSAVAEERGAATLHLVQDANLIAVGEVASVEYRLSVPSRTKLQVPQTLVTYRLVMPPVRGKFSGELLVLRFPGGADGMGHFVEVEGSPLFQPGDRDVLFIRSNGDRGGCPLVECEWGRFRLLLDEQTKQERVYDTFGKPIFAIDKALVKSSGPVPAAFRTFSFPTPSFDSLMNNPEVREIAAKLGKPLDELKKEYDAGAPSVMTLVDATARRLRVLDSSVDGSQVPGDNRVRKPLFVETFLKVVEEVGGGLAPPRLEIVSVDPKAPLLFESSRLSRPPASVDEGKPTASASRAPTAAKRATTRQEARELEAMQANGFNPVIR